MQKDVAQHEKHIKLCVKIPFGEKRITGNIGGAKHDKQNDG